MKKNRDQRQEIDANRFARALLMPKPMFIESVNKHKENGKYGDSLLKALSKEYVVEMGVVRDRMVELELISL